VLLAGCAGCNSGLGTDTKAKDEADIKAMEGRFIAAFKAKDINAIMACYVPDQSLIVFDVSPPRQFTGAQAYKMDWQGYLAAFPGPWDASISDLDVTVGGDIGYGHSIQHASFTDKDGKKAELTVRVTDGYKKINSQWLISHEHVSVPVDLNTLKPDLDSK
jgi:ketosteroid isomerase-like protein